MIPAGALDSCALRPAPKIPPEQDQAIRLALVRLGRIACEQHLPAIAATPEIELVAVASRHSRLDGVECFATVEELLAEVADVDAFALCEMAAGLVNDALMMAIRRRGKPDALLPCAIRTIGYITPVDRGAGRAVDLLALQGLAGIEACERAELRHRA